MQVSSLTDVFTSAYNTVKHSANWLGHKVVVLSKAALSVGEKAYKAVAFGVQSIWNMVKPVFTKAFGFITSPLGTFGLLTGAAGFCVKTAFARKDAKEQQALGALGVASAIAAGFVAGRAGLV